MYGEVKGSSGSLETKKNSMLGNKLVSSTRYSVEVSMDVCWMKKL